MNKKTILSPRFSPSNGAKNQDVEFNKFQQDLFGNETDKKNNFLAAIKRMHTLIDKVFPEETNQTANTNDKNSVEDALKNFTSHVKNNSEIALSAYDAFIKLVFGLEYGDTDIEIKKQTILGLVDPLSRCVQGAAGEIYSRAIGLHSQSMSEKITAFANNLLSKYFYKDGGRDNNIHMRNQYIISAFSVGLQVLPIPAKETYGRRANYEKLKNRINEDYTINNLLEELWHESTANLAAIKTIGNCVTVNPEAPTNKRALELFKFCGLTKDDLYNFYKVDGIDNFGGIAALCDAIVESDIDECVIIKNEEDKSEISTTKFGIEFIADSNVIHIYRKINDKIEQYTITGPAELIDELNSQKTTIKPYDFANIFYDLFKVSDPKNLKPNQKSILDRLEINEDFLQYKIYKQLINDEMLYDIEKSQNILNTEQIGPQTLARPTKDGQYDVIKIQNGIESKNYFSINGNFSHTEDIATTIIKANTISEIINTLNSNLGTLTKINKKTYKDVINKVYSHIEKNYGIAGIICLMDSLHKKESSLLTLLDQDKVDNLLQKIIQSKVKGLENKTLKLAQLYLNCISQDKIIDYKQQINQICSAIYTNYGINCMARFVCDLNKKQNPSEILNQDNLNNLLDYNINNYYNKTEENFLLFTEACLTCLQTFGTIYNYHDKANEFYSYISKNYGLDGVIKYISIVSNQKQRKLLYLNKNNLNNLLQHITSAYTLSTEEQTLKLVNLYLSGIPQDKIIDYKVQINQICSDVYKKYGANCMSQLINDVNIKFNNPPEIFNEDNLNNLLQHIVNNDNQKSETQTTNLVKIYLSCIPQDRIIDYKTQINQICSTFYKNHGANGMAQFMSDVNTKFNNPPGIFNEDNLDNLLQHVINNDNQKSETQTTNLVKIYLSCIAQDRIIYYKTQINQICSAFYKNHGANGMAQFISDVNTKFNNLPEILNEENLNLVFENIQKRQNSKSLIKSLIKAYINNIPTTKLYDYEDKINTIYKDYYKNNGLDETAEMIAQHDKDILYILTPNLKNNLTEHLILHNISFISDNYLQKIFEQSKESYQEELNKIFRNLIKNRKFNLIQKLIASEKLKEIDLSEYLHPETKFSIIEMCKKVNDSQQRISILEATIFSENFLQSLEDTIQTNPNIVKKLLKDLVIPSNDYNTNHTLLDSIAIMSEIQSNKYPLLKQMFHNINSSSLAIPKSINIESFNYDSIESQIKQLKRIRKTRILRRRLYTITLALMLVGIIVGLTFAVLPIAGVFAASLSVSLSLVGGLYLYGYLKQLKYETFDITKDNALSRLYKLRTLFKTSVIKFLTSKNSFQNDASQNVIIKFNQKDTLLNAVSNSSLTYIINQGISLLSSALNPKNESLELPITLTRPGITTVLENTLYCCGQLLSNKQPFDKQLYESTFTVIVKAINSTPLKFSALNFFNQNLQQNTNAKTLFEQICRNQKVNYDGIIAELNKHQPSLTFIRPNNLMYLKNEPENNNIEDYQPILGKSNKNVLLRKLKLTSEDELDKIIKNIYNALNDSDNPAKTNTKKPSRKSTIYNIGLLAKNQSLCVKYDLNPQQISIIHKHFLPKSNRQAPQKKSGV